MSSGHANGSTSCYGPSLPISSQVFCNNFILFRHYSMKYAYTIYSSFSIPWFVSLSYHHVFHICIVCY
jgi:hypothetical protein